MTSTFLRCEQANRRHASRNYFHGSLCAWHFVFFKKYYIQELDTCLHQLFRTLARKSDLIWRQWNTYNDGINKPEREVFGATEDDTTGMESTRTDHFQSRRFKFYEIKTPNAQKGTAGSAQYIANIFPSIPFALLATFAKNTGRPTKNDGKRTLRSIPNAKIPA